MAKPKYNPGKHLLAFVAGLVVLFSLVALGGNWKPALGLDLQGGTRITLTAVGNPSATQLDEARQIIDKRVNGSGVAEADVTTQSGGHIVVEIPGDSRRDLIDVVQRQARLGMRLIACSDAVPGAASSRCAAPGADKEIATPAGDADKALAWREAPSAKWVAKYNAATCPITGDLPEEHDDPASPLVTCQEIKSASGGTTYAKYLLTAAAVEGSDLSKADAGQNQGAVDWLVQITLKSDGAKQFAKVSAALNANNQEQFAIVLDGAPISVPTMQSGSLSRVSSISGNMSQREATDLATSLKYGALPVAFEKAPNAETVGASLAGDQLTAGLIAGGIGLGLVMLFCLIYYRGLGIVVLASLSVAGGATYGMVLLLSKTAGFTLTLPGIAGLIIAVGVTADSFIIFFERIRDEMREGKSMRVAVESGWVRAKRTRIAASVVSLLSAFILYIFATGVVKGFGFALGLSTVMDLAVLFWFTKPLVSWLAHFRFFNGGGRMSGLSIETLGTDTVAAGGRA
jgi:preprotein translocase subunit SecD